MGALRREGLDAVTVRKVAAELGTGPASLYVHVSRREELLRLMHDAVIATVPLPGLPGAPRGLACPADHPRDRRGARAAWGCDLIALNIGAVTYEVSVAAPRRAAAQTPCRRRWNTGTPASPSRSGCRSRPGPLPASRFEGGRVGRWSGRGAARPRRGGADRRPRTRPRRDGGLNRERWGAANVSRAGNANGPRKPVVSRGRSSVRASARRRGIRP
ncbi:helix-turn-helix domain-containing protein [Streptomyces sp. NPDC051578]|uniref:helix-turn-helix domain-containing protein n=1 Tax=Streptomyces sp. NPDC051578 TaxID=3365662 RepID=UPI0037BB21EA